MVQVKNQYYSDSIVLFSTNTVSNDMVLAASVLKLFSTNSFTNMMWFYISGKLYYGYQRQL